MTSTNKLKAPEGMKSIDELVTETAIELAELHARFMGNDVCRCPLCHAIANQKKRGNWNYGSIQNSK